MKKLLLYLSGLFSFSTSAQTTTLVIPLSQGNGQDTYLASGAPSTNYGNHPSMGGNTWTCGGSLCLSRGLFRFDMSAVPSNVTILNASLQLFADLNWSNSPTTGPANDGYLSRVTAPWGEYSVTWGNQPSVTTVHQLNVPASTSAAQNYTLNVTSLVQDMLTTSNYGFLLQMQDEINYYKSLMFASSDNAVPARCPVLTITYGPPCALAASFTQSPGANGQFNFTSTSTGVAGSPSYNWNFGDSSTGTGAAITHTYTSNGSYTVTLSVSNGSCTSTFTQAITVTNAPSPCNIAASFAYNMGANGSVTFSSTSTGVTGNTLYHWNYGDTFTGSGAAVSHIYTNNGNYIITLSVSQGSCTSTFTEAITVTNVQTPCNSTASFTYAEGANSSVSFSSTSTGTVAGTMCTWNFGDGSSGVGSPVSHTYTNNGIYVVALSFTAPCATSYTLPLTINNVRVGIRESAAQLPVAVFPNPSAGFLHIESPAINSETELTLYDISGKIVYKTNIISSPAAINIQQLGNGMYHYRLRQNEKTLKEGSVLLNK